MFLSDVVVIACGGAAVNASEYSAEEQGIRLEKISKNRSTIPMGDADALRRGIEGNRIVIPFCILGGDLGIDLVKDVIRCARDTGSKVVSVFGIPMEFEKDRRERALRSLPEMVSLSDCSLVIDMQKTFDLNLGYNKGQRDWVQFLRMSDHMMMFSLTSICNYLETGPFFTVFEKNLYAFISHSDVLPANAVSSAWDSVLFDENPPLDSSVIMVGSRISSSEVEEIRNRVVMDHGVMPDVIKRSDPDDSKVIIFRAIRPF